MTKTRLVVALGAVALALGAAAAVKASIPDGAGTIHGCYSKSAPPGGQPGALRVVDTALGQSCTLSESSVNWSQTGPAGPQGPQGVRGPTGPKGDKGDPGVSSYGAGTGLSLSGNTFSIQNTYQLPQGCTNNQSPFQFGNVPGHPFWGCFTAANAGESCSSGKFQNGVDANGDIKCATPPGTGALTAEANTSGDVGIPDDSNPVTVTETDSMPAGSYLVWAKGVVASEENVSGLGGLSCVLFGGDASDGSYFSKAVLNDTLTSSFAYSDLVTLATPQAIGIDCFATPGGDGLVIQDAGIIVLKVA